MSTILISDSTSYLPENLISDYGIIIIPLNLHLEGKSYKEGRDISHAEFYNIFKSSKMFPTTSQPSAGEFLEVFQRLTPDDEALVILISAELSGTMQSALMARNMLETERQKNIHIIDSRSSSMGMGFQLLKAGKMFAQGRTMSEVIEEVERITIQQEIYFIVDNLEYLVRGGRLSKSSGLIGNLLQLKPVLTVREGKLELFDKVRTSSRAVKLMKQQVEKNKSWIKRLAVIHVQAEEEASKLQQDLQEQYGITALISEAGPVIGAHTGPGTLGIAFC
ncbi:MAG: DegV family protein [Syntrophomonadaceae bacterium]|jgi:DegV family protein with EDD domain|nr:DegV family protein [Syntrophomonadaceae bacterium]